VGDLGGELDVLGAERGDVDGDIVAYRVVDELQGLSEPGSLILGERQRVRLALVDEKLAPPHQPTDVDDLSGSGERPVERHTMPALDDLRPRRPEPEHETASGY